ncbi:MAG: phage tail protein [Pseudomonadota bacterium]|nr:phage tail protein [Pseudomonadota bacterium]
MVAASALFSAVPAGAVMPYAGSVAPAGWLLCYGQAISRTDYAALFSSIGTTYGVGDGSTTFNLPDMRGRAVFGKDDMGGAAAGRLNNTSISGTAQNPDGTTLGATGGSDRRAIARNAAVTPVGTGSAVADTIAFDGITVAENGGYAGGTVNSAATPPAIVLNYIIKA